MIYQRFVVGAPARIHGQYRAAHQMWENGDGTSMFLVECDDLGMARLSADAQVTVFPSLNTPTSALTGAAQTYVNAQAVTINAGDTVLNTLRAIRTKKGISQSAALIDQPA